MATLVIAAAAAAQLPSDQKLSAADVKGFTDEIKRLQTLLINGNDRGAIKYQIAKTYAWGGQYRQSMMWLQKVVDENLGFDPSKDEAFRALQRVSEFQALQLKVGSQITRVSKSYRVAEIDEANLLPENLAYDVHSSAHYLGSTVRDTVVRCVEKGTCMPFVTAHREGLGSVLGLKIDRKANSLWTTSNEANAASLCEYSLSSGKLVRIAALPGRHVFNDLVVTSRGRVFVTDTAQGSVYEFAGTSTTPKPFLGEHQFVAANGIAISPDEKILFVASFGAGITAIDLVSQRAKPLRHPSNLSLAYIDGLYAFRGNLIAIRNGPMAPRIVRLVLGPDHSSITRMDVLERKNPLFDRVTTGVVSGDRLYYIANSTA